MGLRYKLFMFLIVANEVVNPFEIKSHFHFSSSRFTHVSQKYYIHNGITLCAKRRPNSDPFEDDNDFDIFDKDELEDRPQRRRRRRRRRRAQIDYLNDPGSTRFNLPSPFENANNNFSKSNSKTASIRLPSSLTTPILAGIFLLGIGTGVTIDSEINTDPRDLASRDAIDKQAPNPTLCTAYGASAMAFDQRVFVSFNPFNVYVAQADVKPACVLRPENVAPVLKQQTRLLNEKEIQSCKKNMNTWAFVGNLQDVPQLSCVYKSEDAQNEFLSNNPKLGIGEDVWDDDREKITKMMNLNSNNNFGGTDDNPNTKKVIKDMMTEGQLKKQMQLQMQVDESILK